MTLTAAQQDRAIGAIVGSAAGDALGSQYEFGPGHPDSFIPEFGVGAMQHPLGCWTDDTDMAVPILRAIAGNLGPECLLEEPNESAYTAIAQEWQRWAEDPLDIGVQTRSIMHHAKQLAAVRGEENITAADLREAAREHHEHKGCSGGNGALMRTTPVALVALGTPNDGATATVAQVAVDIAQLTHWENDNIDACALWSLAIRHAILTGELSFAHGLDWIRAQDRGRAERWQTFIDEATAPGSHPRDFAAQNGWVVSAFQAALAAVTGSGDSYVEAVYRAIRGGRDTDTVAAIAGALAGALAGVSQVPQSWKDVLHGLPNYTCADLERFTHAAIAQQAPSTPADASQVRETPEPDMHKADSDSLQTIRAGIDVLLAGYVVQWTGGERTPDGAIIMPWPEYDPDVHNALTEAYAQIGPDYEYLDHWDAIRDTPVSELTRAQLGTFFTYLLRGERFSTGHIEHYVKNGDLLEALQLAVAFLGQN